MTDCFSEVERSQEVIVWNSGKFVTQLGLFDDCLSNSSLKYGLLDMFNKTTHKPLGVMMGTCLPNICNDQQIEELANEALEFTNLPIQASYIESPENYNPDFNPVFYVTVSLIAIFIIFLILTTFMKALRKIKFISVWNLENSMKIFQYKESQLNIFNGVKTICMLWVIFGHLFSIRLQNSVNALTIENQVQETFFLFVLSAFFAVDVFFYIGGFLVAYSFLRNSMKSSLKYPLSIVHRILRFWPSYIMAIIIYYSIFLHTGDGPLWWSVQIAGQVNNCATIWKPLLFVDNLVDNGESMCLGWGWYLQNDMQIFILSVPILFLYQKKRIISLLSIVALMIGSFIINFVTVQVNQYITVAHRPDFAKWNHYFPNVYIKPWIRCPPYFYGLFLGLLYMQYTFSEEKQKTFFGKVKIKFQNSRFFKNSIQILGICMMLFIILIPRTLQVGHKWPQVIHSLYLTFGKFIFVIGTSLAVTPALLKIKDDFLFFLLDTKLFNLTSKISFWVYLIHYMVVEFVCYRQKVDFYYNIEGVLALYFGIVLMSMILGFLGTILIEIPFSKLEKMIFEGKSKKKQDKIQDKKGEQIKKEEGLNETIVSAEEKK